MLTGSYKRFTRPHDVFVCMYALSMHDIKDIERERVIQIATLVADTSPWSCDLL